MLEDRVRTLCDAEPRRVRSAVGRLTDFIYFEADGHIRALAGSRAALIYPDGVVAGALLDYALAPCR